LTCAALVGGRRGVRRANLARPGREQPKSGRSALAGSEKEEGYAPSAVSPARDPGGLPLHRRPSTHILIRPQIAWRRSLAAG